jgi:hypothetical protein
VQRKAAERQFLQLSPRDYDFLLVVNRWGYWGKSTLAWSSNLDKGVLKINSEGCHFDSNRRIAGNMWLTDRCQMSQSGTHNSQLTCILSLWKERGMLVFNWRCITVARCSLSVIRESQQVVFNQPLNEKPLFVNIITTFVNKSRIPKLALQLI